MDIGYVSALTGLAAVVLSPLVAIYTVRTNANLQVLSGNRQAWIESLRSSISEYCGLMNHLNQARSLGHLDYDKSYPMLQESFELETKIFLLINPDEEKHKRISALTTSARISVFGTPDKYDPEIWNEAWVELIRITNSIIAEEWKRVKQIR